MRQSWMAAGEDQPQAIVGDRAVIRLARMLCGLQARKLREAVGAIGQRAAPAKAVDGAPARGSCQPGSRITRYPVARPCGNGRRESVLHGILGQLKVADMAYQRRQRSGPMLATGRI